nr:translation initiation factor IF-2-like [Saimiri boliviensis boliviensis]
MRLKKWGSGHMRTGELKLYSSGEGGFSCGASDKHESNCSKSGIQDAFLLLDMSFPCSSTMKDVVSMTLTNLFSNISATKTYGRKFGGTRRVRLPSWEFPRLALLFEKKVRRAPHAPPPAPPTRESAAASGCAPSAPPSGSSARASSGCSLAAVPRPPGLERQRRGRSLAHGRRVSTAAARRIRAPREAAQTKPTRRLAEDPESTSACRRSGCSPAPGATRGPTAARGMGSCRPRALGATAAARLFPTLRSSGLGRARRGRRRHAPEQAGGELTRPRGPPRLPCPHSGLLRGRTGGKRARCGGDSDCCWPGSGTSQGMRTHNSYLQGLSLYYSDDWN